MVLYMISKNNPVISIFLVVLVSLSAAGIISGCGNENSKLPGLSNDQSGAVY